ncbi:ELWxxDGT repeat protein [Corallococcus sp. RDP092CA]|uniref:ELWxxDGT repeat protein n=1 Tax=Corallococcus sp. RDP092CA TaxID=3109369 RepID=UPI0035B0A9ED
MAAWRGVPVLVLLLTGALGVGCGSAEEGADVSAVGEASGALESFGGPQPCGPSARPVGDLRSGAEGSAPEALVALNGRVVYVANDGVSGRELWVTEGSGAESRLVKDLWPGAYGSTPRFLTRMGGRLFFVADDGAHGPELWRTDGTAKGTVLVADIRPGAQGSAPDGLTVVGGRLYFTADDGVRGRELWQTDGTAKGTRLTQEFAPGAASLFLDDLTEWNGSLALVAYGSTVSLWVVDGRSGSARVLFSASEQSVIFSLTPAGKDRLFFLADTGLGEADLWVTRGQLLSTFPLLHFPGDYPAELTPLGNAVYFMAGAEGFFGEPGDLLHGGELWKSDGTLLGTGLVKDIQPGPGSSLPSGLTVLNGRLYFAADDGVHGRELWRTDGTAQGTLLVQDLEPGPQGSAPAAFAAVDGWLFFSATTSGRGREGWYSNGDPCRVDPMRDIALAGLDANPRGFVRAGASVFFTATRPEQGEEPWLLPFLPAARCARLER